MPALKEAQLEVAVLRKRITQCRFVFHMRYWRGGHERIKIRDVLVRPLVPASCAALNCLAGCGVAGEVTLECGLGNSLGFGCPGFISLARTPPDLTVST